MRALVFADRQGNELAPLTDQVPLALLPVAGKEVLVHCIEDLVGAGVRELVVVVSALADQIEAAIGDGQRWGVGIRYVLSRGEEDPAAVWRRLSLSENLPLLALRGDVLRTPAVAGFLDQAQAFPGSIIAAMPVDPRAGLILLRAHADTPLGDEQGLSPALRLLNWSATVRADARSAVIQLLAMEGVTYNLLTDLPAYHLANRDLVAGRLPGMAPPGRLLALGLRVGPRARIVPRSLKQGVAFVGANSRVHPEAELLGEVIIGDEVVVDRGATIRDSVILSGTYVGELIEVANAIVASNLLIRVDTGAVLRISDTLLLADLAGGGVGGEAARWLDRFLGLLLLALSLPLWPLAAAMAYREVRGRPLLGSRGYLGNLPASPSAESGGQGPMELRHWRTSVPVLRNLPWLIAVVRGNLRLVGVSPLTPDESAARSEDWQFVRDGAPVGLFGPTQFTLPANAPIEERLLSDAFYARQRGWLSDLGFLWQGLKRLFSAEVWRGQE
jgi:NDP-sugar pyrophosphorylase family protein